MRLSLPVTDKQHTRVGALEAQAREAATLAQIAERRLLDYLDAILDGAGIPAAGYAGRVDGAILLDVPDPADTPDEPLTPTEGG